MAISEPVPVDKAERVPADIAERIEAAHESNRITLEIASRLRIVVAVVVVEGGGFGVEVLARQYSDRPLPSRAGFAWR